MIWRITVLVAVVLFMWTLMGVNDVTSPIQVEVTIGGPR